MIKNQKGFTLIELILVVAILSVIAAIVVPNVLFAVDNARISSDKTNARIIADAIQQVITKDNQVNRVDINVPVEFNADNPNVAEVVAGDQVQTLIDYSIARIQSVPLVTYGETRGTKFYVTIGDTTGISVFTDIDADPTNETFVKLYPSPEGDWDN